MFTYIKHLPYQFIRILYVQLVISIYSFLITVFWGIPFSPLSFLGNLFFNPVLILFLGLCTLLFFTELCFIPNQYIVYLLEFVSSWWLYVLKLGPGNIYNISCKPPSYLVLAIMMCATFIIVVHQSSHLIKCGYLLLVLLLGFWSTQQQERVISIDNLPCNQGQLYIVATEDQLIVIDQGYLGRYLSSESYVEYTLMPTITKKYGTRTIDHVILLQPTAMGCKALKKLMELACVKHLYLPLWQGDHKNMAIQCMHMKQTALKKECTVHRLNAPQYTITKQLNCCVDIVQTNEQIKSGNITYNAYMVTSMIDNQSFTFYPARYPRQTLN